MQTIEISETSFTCARKPQKPPALFLAVLEDKTVVRCSAFSGIFPVFRLLPLAHVRKENKKEGQGAAVTGCLGKDVLNEKGGLKMSSCSCSYPR